jgi:MFS family permease
MSTLDLAIANTALPTIAADLHTNAEASIWIVNAYQLALIATACCLQLWVKSPAALGADAHRGGRRIAKNPAQPPVLDGSLL